MSHGSDTVWRGDLDGGFQTQAIGNYAPISDVADKDNIYLSDQGWAYRHFTSLDKAEYWDEILWAGEVTVPPGLNKPVGQFGAPEQQFIYGNGVQSIGGIFDHAHPQPDPDTPTLGVAEVIGPYEVEEEDAVQYSVTTSGTYTGTKTYQWIIIQDAKDVSSDHTITNGTTDTATITFGAESEGEYHVSCTVSATGLDPAQDSLKVDVVAKEVVYNIGVVKFGDLTADIFEVLPGTNNVVVSYSGNAPIGSVSNLLTCSNSDVVIPQTGSGPSFSGGSYFQYNVRVPNTVPMNTDITLTATISDATAEDNGGPATTATHNFQVEGTLGSITCTRSPSGILAANTLPLTVTLSSTQTGALGDQSDTTIQWSVNPAVPAALRATLENSFTTPTAAATDVVIPTNMELGNTQFICTYSNPAMNPPQKSGTVLVTVL